MIFGKDTKTGRLRLYEAGRAYTLSRAIAHAATKRELVAKQQPSRWMPPSMFRPPEAEAELNEISIALVEWHRLRLEPGARLPPCPGLLFLLTIIYGIVNSF